MTPRTTRRTLLAASLLAAGLGLPGCGSPSSREGGGSDQGGSAAGWPRKIEHALGTTTLSAMPRTIVSTSVVLTGSLLAIEAPVVGSGATVPGGPGIDDKGFFTQWAAIADERGVQVLYDNSELDLEAVQAAAPDLILLSPVGGDAAADQYEQLGQIAPAVAIDYNSSRWEDVTRELGRITGREEKAQSVIDDFAAKIAEMSRRITPPAEPVQLIAYQGDNGAAFALPTGPHADLMSELGFTVAPLPEGAQTEEGRGDVAFLSPEAAVAGLTAATVLLIDGDDKTVEALRADPIYQGVPAMSGRIVPLGHPSFKLDYYAALDMAAHVEAGFGG